VKQTSTPPATRVLTKLSAPFIRSAPAVQKGLCYPIDQPLFAAFVKGSGSIAAITNGSWATLCDHGVNSVTASGEFSAVTRPWLAQNPRLWLLFSDRVRLS
jgi:hypothetical protein